MKRAVPKPKGDPLRTDTVM